MTKRDRAQVQAPPDEATYEEPEAQVEEQEAVDGQTEQVPYQVPTLILTFDEVGDVVYSTPNESLDINLACVMVDMVKLKFMSLLANQVQQERARQAATKPKLLVPSR